MTVILPVTIIQRLVYTSAGSDKQAPFGGGDRCWWLRHGGWLDHRRTRHIQPHPSSFNYLLENADCAAVLWIVDQSGPSSVMLPRCTAWANSFLFMQDQISRMSLLMKHFGWGWSGSPAKVGMVPSLWANPCGGEFTHLQSLAPHAAEAKGQRCHFIATKDAKLLLIIRLTTKTLNPADKDETFLAA